ncbi:MAG TPA: hypothetical protein VGP41_06140 [Candidatus Lustribacter sp.]|nr:hypothetical protein [Candidatus Lustribacter sp.]
MKHFLATLALVAFAAAPALADPKSDLMAAMMQFGKASSYHMDVAGKGRTMEADVVLPNKMHMTSAQFEMIKIDQTTWVKMGGKWQQFTMPGMEQIMGSVNSTLATTHPTDQMVVTDLGMKSPASGGPPLHAYTVTNEAGKSPSTMFLDGGRLVEVDNTDGTMVRFSKFNDPIDISPPM